MVRVFEVTDNSVLKIQWNLGNSCNLDCSYCHQSLKDGTNPFPGIARLRPAFAHLVEQARAFSLVHIEIPGGEPTESDSLKELMLENTSPEIHFKLYSNAQADLTWWSTVSSKLYELDLTYHTSTDLEHFISVVEIIKRTKCKLKILIAHTPNNWIFAQTAYTKLKALNKYTLIQMLFKNFTKGNNQYFDYTEDQWNIYFNSIGINPLDKQQIQKTQEYKKINSLNNFYGHLCNAGYSQIIVDNFGYVYRGWCKASGHMGNLYDGSFILDSRPRPCPKQQCSNGFDLLAKKSEKSWGMV